MKDLTKGKPSRLILAFAIPIFMANILQLTYAVGMSTVPEVIVANHCGIKVFGVSVITDLGVEGKIVEVSHEEVQKAADEAQPRMTTIMREMINRI